MFWVSAAKGIFSEFFVVGTPLPRLTGLSQKTFLPES